MNIDTPATYNSCARAAMAALAAKYPRSEAQWMVRTIFEELKGWTPTDMILKGDQEATPYIVDRVSDTVDRLLHDEPLQYIFQSARFYGLTFKVTPATLIPRPETEQLIDMIADRYRSTPDLKILDIATGSGCIAIALGRTLPFCSVSAIDLSPEAIAVARENAIRLKTRVDFSVADALHLAGPARPPYDIIVSNPPYITDSEKPDIEPNVLLYEPHMALFVPDSDPLQFYRAISRYALGALRNGGTLWFEINPMFDTQLRAMLDNDGWSDIDIIADERGKFRFATATKPTTP